MAREGKTPFINFKDGINAVPGIFGTRREAHNILNLDVDDQGWLSPRKGTRAIVIESNKSSINDFRTPSGYVTVGTRDGEYSGS